MFHGEYESLTALYNASQNFCPRPIAWGAYKSIPNAHFFLSAFVDMVDELPDLHQYPEKVAQLHQRATAPDGKYGFHVQSICGPLSMHATQTESWEEFFFNYMRYFMAAERRTHGDPSEEMARLEYVFLTQIVPRLCRPLETGTRQIEPRLLHSDLWDGNAATGARTMEPMIFDPACIYGHNECQ